jgi:hypothetical protein
VPTDGVDEVVKKQDDLDAVTYEFSMLSLAPLPHTRSQRNREPPIETRAAVDYNLPE